MTTLKKTLKRDSLLVTSNIAVMTITFLVLGIFISAIAFSQTALRMLEKQAQVTIFFKDDFPEENILALKSNIDADARTLDVRYVSKEDAFLIFTEINKNDEILLESVSASILPASIEVSAKYIDELPVLAQEYGEIDGVEEVRFFNDVISRFRHWSNIAYVAGFSLVAVFLIISFSVISITLRITIAAKGKELEILKLVGASDTYVKKPLIHQGLFFGLTSSLIASSILILTSIIVQLSGTFSGSIEFAFLPEFALNLIVFSLTLSFVLIVSGAALGYFGSVAAIKKYLEY
jgi:cell division transport system permease protein